MNLAWCIDGVNVFETVSAKYVGQSLVLTGNGWTEKRPFQYEAYIGPNGWEVTIIELTGRKGNYAGATYNLPLTIATAVKRLM